MLIIIAISHRSRFHFACSFKLVTLLLSMLPENGDSGQVVVDLKKLYKLIWSHSEFVPVMSSERDEETKGMQTADFIHSLILAR